MAADIQLTRNPSGGTNFGQSATDLIALYGKTPIAQRTSTQLATSLISASTYVTVGANTTAIILEIVNALVAFGVMKTA